MRFERRITALEAQCYPRMIAAIAAESGLSVDVDDLIAAADAFFAMLLDQQLAAEGD
jgi:hypothetical protein